MLAAGAISHAFDREAGGYSARWNDVPLVQTWRARVLAAVVRAAPVPSRVIDVGCGDGADAAALAAGGYDVVGVDISPAMVRAARQRGVAAEVGNAAADGLLDGASPFEVLLSNFGVVNCLPGLAGLVRNATRLVRPGGAVVVVSMGPWAVAEVLARLRRGRLPRRHRGTARVRGDLVPVTYWSPSGVVRAFGADFFVERVEALGLLVPPPDEGGQLGRRSRVEPAFARLPVLRSLGDHAIVVLRRCG